MMDPAVRILAKAIYDVVDTEDERKEELGKTMRGDFNEFDLRPHFEDLSPNEKAACSDRAENLAVEHNQAEPTNGQIVRNLERVLVDRELLPRRRVERIDLAVAHRDK